MSGAHTPGPWIGKTQSVHTADGRPIVNSIWIPPQPPKGPGVALQTEADANLRLIAAAPDLLAALKTVLSSDMAQRVEYDREEPSDTLAIVRAAIAKAEGENAMIFRIYHKLAGAHVHMRVFSGTHDGALGKCGDLTMREDEFAEFHARTGHIIQFYPEDWQ